MSSRLLACALCVTGMTPFGVSHALGAELTIDISDYRYREVENGEFFMHESSPPFLSAGVRDWDRPKADGDFGAMYAAEIGGGRTAYDSRNSGMQNKP
ncbi:MAG: hypothetical protein VW338_06375 [Rhodospirillaceae bacterium]